MKRKTPLRRKTALKRRVGLRRVSPHRRAELKLYAALKPSWLARVPFCEFPQPGGNPCHRRATMVHHIKGRQGALLTDMRYWMGVCAECHAWIHGNAKTSRKMGVLKF